MERPDYAHRVNLLRATAAHIRSLSLEPVLAPTPSLKLRGIHWVIIGGEFSTGARPLLAVWATNIRDQCRKANVGLNFKQWGGVIKKRHGRFLECCTWDGMPNAGASLAPARQPEPAPA